MGNCLAPFQLTGQSNLFHVMALFTWPDKATCKASELIYVDEIDQEIPNLCLQTSVHIQQQHTTASSVVQIWSLWGAQVQVSSEAS